MAQLMQRCPHDGEWLTAFPGPTTAGYVCGKCGRGFQGSAKDGSLLPDPEYSQVPTWLSAVVQQLRNATSASTASVVGGESVVTELRELEQRADGELRAAIANVADRAESAARQARSTADGVNLIWARLAEVQKSLENAGIKELVAAVDKLALDVADMRRQLRDHVDRH